MYFWMTAIKIFCNSIVHAEKMFLAFHCCVLLNKHRENITWNESRAVLQVIYWTTTANRNKLYTSSIPYLWSHALNSIWPRACDQSMGWSKYLILQENELWRFPHWNRIQCAWCRNASLNKIYTQPCVYCLQTTNEYWEARQNCIYSSALKNPVVK